MESRAHALIAGSFILLLGLAAGAAVWWLGYGRGDLKQYVLVARQNVTGLNLQAPVRYRGIRAGRVEAIELDPADPRLILVRISLDARYPVTAGTTARLNTQGLTGIAYVQLEDDGSRPEPLAASGGELPRIALKPTLMDTLGGQLGDIADRTAEVMARLSALLDERGSLRQSLDRLAAASGDLRESARQLPATVAALQRLLSGDNAGRLASTLANLEQASREAPPLVGEMRRTLGTLSSLAERLDTLAGEAGGELTAGTLPRAHQLLDELAAVSRRLSRLAEALEREPQSLLFGRPSPPPGPGEAGFTATGR